MKADQALPSVGKSSSPAYLLYGFAQSGNAYKVALMLQLSGASWAPRFVDYFKGETRTSDYRAINVMGEVPVLEVRASSKKARPLRLSQSGVILDYLATHLQQFGPQNDIERREILRWTLFDNHKLSSYIATLRFLMQFAASPDPAVIEFLKARVKNALSVLDAHLSTQDFAVGGRPTIADLSMCGYLFWNEEFGVNWADHPHVGRWLASLQRLPGWVHPYRLLPGHPLPAA
jgi:glutathione S-transferase